jgi:hypothetical protein
VYVLATTKAGTGWVKAKWIRPRVPSASRGLRVPVSLFPTPGRTTVETRRADDGAGGVVQLIEAAHRVQGLQGREVIIWLADQYVEPRLGRAIPVATQQVTATGDGGPWFGRTSRLPSGKALMVEIHLAASDDATARAAVSSMVSSIRRC